MYGVCAGAEKAAGRSGEDPTGRTTKEATGNSTIVTVPVTHRYFVNTTARVRAIFLESALRKLCFSQEDCQTNERDLYHIYHLVSNRNCTKELLILQERELKRQQAVMLKEQVSLR